MMLSFLIAFSVSLFAQSDERHAMTNSSVTINAVDYRKSRSIDKVKDGSREFIIGKKSVYNLAGSKDPSKLLQPYAEYIVKSKWAGGTFKVTVTYKIDKDERKENANKTRKVRIGLDENSPMEIELKNSSSGYLKASSEFKINFLRGKNHTVKVWLPSKGVMIDKVEMRRIYFK